MLYPETDFSSVFSQKDGKTIPSAIRDDADDVMFRYGPDRRREYRASRQAAGRHIGHLLSHPLL